MKKFLSLLLLCISCSSAPPPAKTQVEATPCPQPSPAPTCEDKVIVMDEKGASCPANTRATFPSPFGFFQPGKIVVLCQCK